MQVRQLFAYGLGVAATIGFLAVPAAAQASTVLWVSSATTGSGNGTSCTQPGFNTIQDAINAAPVNGVINVCAGTYTEQLQISQSVTIDGLGNVEVQLPSSPVDSSTPCDTAKGTSAFQADQDGIAICGGSSQTVTLNNISVDAAWATNVCDDSLYGILVGGGATLNFDNSSVVAAGAYPLNGCQGGIGIQAGMSWTKPIEVGHLNLADSWISGYQKNGVVVDGFRSTASISESAVIGAGSTMTIAQNGVQVSDSAQLSMTHTTISGNECSDNAAPCGANGLDDTQSAGLLFFGAARNDFVTDCTFTYNDMGLYYLANPNGGAIKRPQVTFTGDQFVDNRYEGAVLDEGSANLTKSSFSRGNVGIEVLQYGGSNGQKFGSFSQASHDTFANVKDSVDVLSDKATGDKAGTFTITFSNIYAAKVLDNSKNLKIIHNHDTK
jgi:hypothetical protein